jgi:hypothetical protein
MRFIVVRLERVDISCPTYAVWVVCRGIEGLVEDRGCHVLSGDLPTVASSLRSETQESVLLWKSDSM